MDRKHLKWKRFKGIGALTGAILVLFFIMGFCYAGGRPAELAVAVLFSVSAAVACGLTAGLRMNVWLSLMGLGILIGIGSSFSYFFGLDFEGRFIVGVVTVVYFTALGIIAGAMFEFIRFIHHLTYGRSAGDYPSQKADGGDIAENEITDNL